MAPTVYAVRHAQGYHNLCVENHKMPDPDLTELGEQQCRDLQDNFPHHDEIDLIVASPIRRTLYTALISFHDTIQRKNLKVIALPELQETSDLPCDTGSPKEKLEEEFANKPVDLSLVPEGWNCKRGKWSPTSQAIQARARAARKFLKNREEKNIVVVTHGGFLHYFTKDWDAFQETAGTGWQNAEWRSYYFKKEDNPEKEDVEADVEEFPESRARRRGRQQDQEEVSNLARTATNESVRESPARQAAIAINAQAVEERPQVIQAKV
ncbi:putative phosphatase SPAC5H10.03 [Pseudocercospora fuligena]|uniref:Putative phosphatase SPAC5H10.03 n=1 Tax=Pseudocercospora fuligena TaxID=685502 RepID=A0A8H6RTY8_9PEZI|nr:putative phosphatase SPAC5H10.03 [Pseudocercospora fuligena]